MSVLIKGMDMPKSCDECDFCATDFDWFHCLAGKQDGGRVLDLENSKNKFIYTESRHPDCPLREIPTPHGRLIDSQKLIENVVENLNNPEASLVGLVGKAPTIIEAEVER